MRKSYLIFVALLLVAVTFLFCGASAINAGRDDITVTQTVLAGEVSAAEGLAVEVRMNENRQLYWITKYDVAEEIHADTEFEFYQSRQQQYGSGPEPSLDFYTGGVGYGISGVIDLEQEVQDNTLYGIGEQMLLPALDLANRTSAGETRTEQLPLRDYYEYYPVDLQFDLSMIEDIEEIRLAHKVFINDYFRLPVPENAYVEVTVTKDSAGQVVEVQCNSFSPVDEFGNPISTADAYTYSDSVILDDAVYLLLHGTADYTQIKGGFGLYRIPVRYVTAYGNYSFEPAQLLMEIEKIENVYPIDPSRSEQFRLSKGVSENEVLLFEQSGDRVIVNVLDASTSAVRQELVLDTDVLPNVWYHENLVVLGTTDYGKPDGRLQVLVYENGVYDLWLDTDFYPLNDEGYLYFEPMFSFDGERFAVGAFHEVYNVASHRITVYDQTGLIFAGDYHVSSDDLTSPITNYDWDDPLKLSWK